MVLAEVVGGAAPERTVVQPVAFCMVAAVVVEDELLIEAVVASQSCLVQVFVVFDTSLFTVGAIHQAQVIVACCHTVPCLSCAFEVADVLVAERESVVHPCQSTIVGA